MFTQSKPQTAAEMELMMGFPPHPDAVVTHETQLYGPYNRWSFQNIQKLNPVADVWRGTDRATLLEYALRDMSEMTYKNRLGTEYRVDNMVELSYTDGIIVMHRGKVIYERYLNGMRPQTLHAWASGSKSMTGTLAAMLAHEGIFDPGARVVDYLPELKTSGFGDATVRQVMDMTTGIRFAEDDHDPVSENFNYSVAMGWRARPYKYEGPENVYEFLPTMLKSGEHGEKFMYLTPNTDVLAWIMKRLTGKTLAELMHERIWAKMGADRDAMWVVGPAAVETSGSGLLTTLPDMARFGQMMLQKGEFNGQQIVPIEVIEQIERGGDKDAFARSAVAGPTNVGASYRDQWWTTQGDHAAYYALGYGGQILWIDPTAQMVVAKFSSYPTPTPDGREFWMAFGAIAALGEELL